MTHDVQNHISSIGYVDNVCIITIIGDSVKENLIFLHQAHDSALLWAKRHSSLFNPAKYLLIHFRHNRINEIFPLQDGTPVPTLASVKYLGVILDQPLNWQPHLEYAEEKTSKRLNAKSSLASSTWGVNAKELRQIYSACILPLAAYGASVWLPDSSSKGGQEVVHTPSLLNLEQFRSKQEKLYQEVILESPGKRII